MDSSVCFIVAFVWFVASLGIAYQAQMRKIHAFAAFLISMLFSPIIGLIVLLMSPEYNVTQDPPTRSASQDSAIDKLIKLADLRDRGLITAEEFEQYKASL